MHAENQKQIRLEAIPSSKSSLLSLCCPHSDTYNDSVPPSQLFVFFIYQMDMCCSENPFYCGYI